MAERYSKDFPEKAVPKFSTLDHYCYGYGRTVHNIVGCQRIPAARDARMTGWMTEPYFRFRDDGTPEVDFEVLKEDVHRSYQTCARHYPLIRKDRIDWGLQVAKELVKSHPECWKEHGDQMKVQPPEWYLGLDQEIPDLSSFAVENSVVYFVILGHLLKLGFYETLIRLAQENPGLSFRIGQPRPSVFVRFNNTDDELKDLKGRLLIAQPGTEVNDVNGAA